MKDIAKLPGLIESDRELLGLNVTIPYKEKVIPYLDEIDVEAREIGAVNTIKIIRQGTKYHLKGYNTDITGFEKSLTGLLKSCHTSALVLGTGGASKAVVYALKKYGIIYQYVSRTPRDHTMLSYDQIIPEIIRSHKLIINTSPVGMYPNVGHCPQLPYDAIGPDHILYDLIYNPEMTLFLKKGKEKKATLINGLPMLYAQAERSWLIWNE